MGCRVSTSAAVAAVYERPLTPGERSPPPPAFHPFTPGELDDIRALWSHVKRKFEDIAKETLARLFHAHPYFVVLFPALEHLRTETEMMENQLFLLHSVKVLEVFNDIIENLGEDDELVLRRVDEVACIHAEVDGFSSTYFEFLEEPFMDALRARMYDKFSSYEEDLYRRLYKWANKQLVATLESVEAVQKKDRTI